MRAAPVRVVPVGVAPVGVAPVRAAPVRAARGLRWRLRPGHIATYKS